MTDPGFIRPDPEREVSEELEFHIEQIAATYRAKGLDSGAALARARAEFGNAARARSQSVDILSRTVRRRSRLDRVDALRRELVHALRATRRAPGFALVVALTIGFAIGFATLVTGAARVLLIQPLPFPDAGRLVWVFGREPAKGIERDRLSSEESRSIADANAFERVAVFGDRSLVYQAGARPARWHGLRVSPGMATVLGFAPALGRDFTSADGEAAARSFLVTG